MNQTVKPVAAVGATHTGRCTHNEDAYLVDLELGLMLVADGVGGHQAGEVASAITCETVAQEAAAGNSLDQGIRAANRAILTAVSQGRGREGMASTAVGILLNGLEYELAWVGDSRAYLWDGKLLKLLTRDHSLVELLLAQGEITLDKARTHPQRNVIVQAIRLQTEDRLKVDINRGNLQPGEVILLCSDGMSDILDNASIVNILREKSNLQSRCKKLVNSSIEQGGRDNSTVVMIEGMAGKATGSRIDPEIVWSFDPRTGDITQLHQNAPAAAVTESQIRKVPPKRPGTTQMMPLDELEREMARVQSSIEADGSREGSMHKWLALFAALAIIAGGFAYALGFVGVG